MTLACAATYTLSYKRSLQRSLASAEAHPAGPSRLASAARWVLTRAILRQPQERATFFFALNTLARSPKHRLYVVTYTGVGFALAAFGVMEMLVPATRRDIAPLLFQPNPALLAVPLILTFFLLSGMRLAFTMPAELPSNWIFQIAQDKAWIEAGKGTRKAMISAAALLLLVHVPFYAYLWGWPRAFQQLIFSLVLSLMLVELLLMNFRKIPFTCSYQPGKANITVLGIVYCFAFTIYAYTMAALELWLMQDDARWTGFLLLILVMFGGIVVWRETIPIDGSGMVYEDEPNPEIQTLGLGT